MSLCLPVPTPRALLSQGPRSTESPCPRGGNPQPAGLNSCRLLFRQTALGTPVYFPEDLGRIRAVAFASSHLSLISALWDHSSGHPEKPRWRRLVPGRAHTAGPQDVSLHLDLPDMSKSNSGPAAGATWAATATTQGHAYQCLGPHLGRPGRYHGAGKGGVASALALPRDGEWDVGGSGTGNCKGCEVAWLL